MMLDGLYIITNVHLCSPGYDVKKEPPQEDCDAFRYPVTDPRHFVAHKVVSVESVPGTNEYIARSAEGDWTRGYYEPLLKRLSQYALAMQS